MIVCGNCQREVWWSLPRPEDECPECGQPIGKRRVVAVDEPTFHEGKYLLEQDTERLKAVVVPEDLLGLTG